MALEINVEGVEKLVKALSQIQGLDEPLAEVIELYLGKVVDDARALVPIRTGRLQRSIGFWGVEGGYCIGSDVSYASFVEYGARGRSPKPFLTPALFQDIPLLKASLLDKIEAWFRRGGKG